MINKTELLKQLRALPLAERERLLNIAIRPQYEVKIVYEDNVGIARLMRDGEEIAKGHGHDLHGGDYGVAQASIWALKKLADQVRGGGDINDS